MIDWDFTTSGSDSEPTSPGQKSPKKKKLMRNLSFADRDQVFFLLKMYQKEAKRDKKGPKAGLKMRQILAVKTEPF